MQLSFKIDTKHLTPAQYGALVQHVIEKDSFKNIESLKISQEGIYVSVWLKDSDVAEEIDKGVKQEFSKLQSEIRSLAQIEPMPCLCGCGAYLAISPCFAQDERQRLICGLTQEEASLARGVNPIGCIKMIRQRTGMGLKDSKDLHDRFTMLAMTQDERDRKGMRNFDPIPPDPQSLDPVPYTWKTK